MNLLKNNWSYPKWPVARACPKSSSFRTGPSYGPLDCKDGDQEDLLTWGF